MNSLEKHVLQIIGENTARDRRLAYQKAWHQKNKERLNQRARQRYLENKDHILKRQNAYHQQKKNDPEYIKKRRDDQSERRRILTEWWQSYKSTLQCKICGELRWQCLDFHHTDHEKKEFNVSHMIKLMKSKELILDEIKKCIVLCANCHRVIHSK